MHCKLKHFTIHPVIQIVFARNQNLMVKLILSRVGYFQKNEHKKYFEFFEKALLKKRWKEFAIVPQWN